MGSNDDGPSIGRFRPVSVGRLVTRSFDPLVGLSDTDKSPKKNADSMGLLSGSPIFRGFSDFFFASCVYSFVPLLYIRRFIRCLCDRRFYFLCALHCHLLINRIMIQSSRPRD
jgi:hypothetical protein